MEELNSKDEILSEIKLLFQKIHSNLDAVKELIAQFNRKSK
jgi:hypothetical protein